jgi:PKHD-type hydroxylase
MQIVVSGILPQPQLEELHGYLRRAPYEDGRATAGWSAALVKRNEQVSDDPAGDMWRERVAIALSSHPVFRLAAQPKRIIGPIFSRYRPGDAYGIHADEPIMDGSRVDLAFTLFLSPPQSYGGGELVIDGAAGEEAHKYDAGSALLYPATALHRVVPVHEGVRYAAVGWVRSFVRSPANRELLFDLETARQQLFQAHGKTAEHDLLSKCYANLLRMWCED